MNCILKRNIYGQVKNVTTVVGESCTHCYPQNILSNPTQQTTCSLPRKRSFPDELSTFQQRDTIRAFQDLNESIAPAGFQFKELDNCIMYLFGFDGTKFSKILESIKVDDDLHVKLQYNGMPLPLP